MLKKWKTFEQVVAAINKIESNGADVKWNDKINGRQFDVTVRFKHGNLNYLTVIECKVHSSKLSVDKVDAFATKSRDANCNKAVIISKEGFQSGCYEVAERHGIELLTLSESVDFDTDTIVEQVTPIPNIYDINFLNRNLKPCYQVEDCGGSLNYFSRNIKIILNQQNFTPEQFIQDKIKEELNSVAIESKEFVVDFKGKAKINVPHENSFTAYGLSFKAKLINAVLSNKPVVDAHIQEGLSTKFHLKDSNGSVLSSTSLTALRLGNDSPVKGRFYVLPALNNFYYCKEVEQNLITWVVVESYQHGVLCQVTITQKLEYASNYVEVTDNQKINKLKKMLRAYLKKPKTN
jgi:hypothetical protein